MLVVGVGDERVLLPLCLHLQFLDLAIHLLDVAEHGLICDWVQLFRYVFSIDFLHEVGDDVLGLLVLSFLVVIDAYGLFLLLAAALLLQVVELLVDLLDLLGPDGRLALLLALLRLPLLLLLVEGLRQDVDHLGRQVILGTFGALLLILLLLFGLDGDQGGQLHLVLEIHALIL